MGRQLCLENLQAPGDSLMFTCAVRDLHRQYPDEFITSIATRSPDIWLNNPYNKNVDRNHPREDLRIGYSSAIHQSNFRSAHFSTGFCQELSEKLGARINLTDMRPDVYLTPKEMDPATRAVKERYWVVMAGGKSDFTAKMWSQDYWQTLVNKLHNEVQVVQAGAAGHLHKPLTGVLNMLGKTTLREYMQLVYHSDGIICPITCGMHLAAAFNKPCIVVAGGREGWWWEAYTRKTWAVNIPNTPCPADFVDHTFLHTIGQMQCCIGAGCWKNGVNEQTKTKNCKNVIQTPTGACPACLMKITPEMVLQAVHRYMAKQPIPLEDLPKNLLPPLFTEPLPKIARPLLIPPSPPKPPRVYRAIRGGKVNRRRFMLPRAGHPRVTRVVPAQPPAPRPVVHPTPARTAPVTTVQIRLPASTVPWKGKLEVIGPKVTICTILYGNYPDLARRCIGSIYKSVDASMFELRIGMNAVCDTTRAYAQDLISSKGNVRIYDSPVNRFKYPLMFDMFWSNPELTTPWMFWLDDDSHIVSADWLTRMDRYIRIMPDVQVSGKKYFYTLSQSQVDLFKRAPWYTGKDVERRKGMPVSYFATGGFWLAKTALLKQLSWPWVAQSKGPLLNNGGDTMFGVACNQVGARVGNFYYGVAISDYNRRGASQKHPGL